MADLPTAFWGGWITVITVVSLACLAWLVFSIYFSANGHDEDEQTVWDEDLREGTNPAPMWWFWLILFSLVFSVIYLMLYPGLGSFSGFLKWSQGGGLEQSYSAYREDFASLRQEIAAASFEDLRNDPGVMASARRVFDQNCAACHGPDAAGQALLFPDLTNDQWQWGGDATQIEQSIRAGRNAVMPGWLGAMSEAGIEQVTQYVRALGRGAQVADSDPGKTKYATFCSSCHGVNGEGNAALGASDLTDGEWLYGGDAADVARSIAMGKMGVMPAFDDRLDDAQIRMLVAWLTREGR